jgi:CRISPR type IV-associated protein Csf2
MTINNRIEGVFHLTRPLHCASPDKSLVKGDNDNETPTMQMRMVTPSGGLQTIPYFPGNDLRGRLRRKAANLLLDRITVAGKVKMELYAGLTCGSISASPDSAGLTVEEALRARDNVYMGLFGGGARLLRSRYRVADLVPILADTVDLGMVPSRYAEIESGQRRFLPMAGTQDGQKAISGWQLIQNTTIFRIDDVLRVLRPEELETYLSNTDEVTRYQTEILSAQTTRKYEKKQAKAGEIKNGEISKKQGVGNMAAFQSIIAGTPMYFQLDLSDDASDAHVGLMLLSLQSLVREQAIGGWTRAGLGQFTADLTLVRHGESMTVFDKSLAAADATLSGATAQFVSEADTAMCKIKADDMMAFFVPRGDGDEKAAA